MPVLVPLAVPVKTPLAFITTPLKSIQPIFSPHAEPDRVPSLLLATPEELGFRLIQPYNSFQALPVNPTSVTCTLPEVTPKFIQPIFSLQTHFAVVSMVPSLVEANAGITKIMVATIPNNIENNFPLLNIILLCQFLVVSSIPQKHSFCAVDKK